MVFRGFVNRKMFCAVEIGNIIERVNLLKFIRKKGREIHGDFNLDR